MLTLAAAWQQCVIPVQAGIWISGKLLKKAPGLADFALNSARMTHPAFSAMPCSPFASTGSDMRSLPVPHPVEDFQSSKPSANICAFTSSNWACTVQAAVIGPVV